MAYTYDDYDEELTEEEKRLLERAQGSKDFGTGVGATAGTAVGTGAGIAASVLTAGAATPLIPVIAGLGGSLGGFLGGVIGGNDAQAAEEELQAALLKKTEQDRKNAVKSAAIRELGGAYLPNIRGL